MLTAPDRPDAPLKRAGHADLVETAEGETYAVYLCGRPLPGRGRCVLGRETAIQRMVWGEDGWLRTEAGDALPQLTTPAPAAPAPPPRPTVVDRRFDGPDLPPEFQWLRSPWPEELFSLTERPGRLRLFGRETIGSLFRQSLVARRQEAFRYRAETTLTFAPQDFHQAAGLVCYYNSAKFHYLHVTWTEDLGRCIQVMSALPDQPVADAFTAPIALPPGDVRLRVEVDHDSLRFSYAAAEGDWVSPWPSFDASILSDEAAAPGTPNFTGAFVGMACQDSSGQGRPADFSGFLYAEPA